MKSKIEKYRMILSRIAAIIVMFMIFFTESFWETENEMVTFFLFLAGVALVGIGSLGRMWCSLYIAGYKDDKLVMDGPYSLCRNPLYFFSMIGAFGVGFATETFTFPVIFIVLFALYYPFVIKKEEDRLKRLFGVAFEEYKLQVPRFFPRISNFSEPKTYTVNPAVYRAHIFSALWFIWLVGVLELVEGIKMIGLLKPLWKIY